MRRAEDWDQVVNCVEDNKLAKEIKKELSEKKEMIQEQVIGKQTETSKGPIQFSNREIIGQFSENIAHSRT